MKRLLVCLAQFIMSCFSDSSFCQSPYVKQGSIGNSKQPPSRPATPFLHTELKYWQGLEVIFLPPGQSSKYGYAFNYSDFCTGSYSPDCKRISLKEIAGKTARVISVDIDSYQTILTFDVLDMGYPLQVSKEAAVTNIEGVVLKRDIDNARRLYLGKTLYPKISTLYRVHPVSFLSSSHANPRYQYCL